MDQQMETSYKVILFKPFHSAMHQLMRQGQKKIVQAARAAMSEASTDGEIKSLKRTKHGETRLPNVEKFDLGDGYRLIVQLIDGVKKTRVFLFVGSHDDAQRWLDNHKNYKWVRGRNDRELEFVMVSPISHGNDIPVDRLNFDSSDDERAVPLLSHLTEDDWQRLDIPQEAVTLLKSINADSYELDADQIFEDLTERVGDEKASLAIDLLWHANQREWPQLRQRLALISEQADIVAENEAAIAMQAPENSETFITFDDTGLLDEVFERGTLADWMLFLHPEQRQVSDRELRGPARLRGVSGSGKTCVLVHRARSLAKKYGEQVLLVTLTESMRKLLERLVEDLCGVERSRIQVKTMSMLAKDMISDSGQRLTAQSEQIEEAFRAAETVIRNHDDFQRSVLRSINPSKFSSFIRTEISYVRGRLISSKLPEYLEPKFFQRTGRGTPLNQLDRRIMLEGINAYLKCLSERGVIDHELLVSTVIDYIKSGEYQIGRYRCVLSDEVQDLSELDLMLMASMKTASGNEISKVPDGLFLAGDGAQSIYKRGFVLRRIGIDIVGRSFFLKKNYRNSHEILKAAFGLVSQFEFADVDEEKLAKPSMPDFAERHGTKPMIVTCRTAQDEVEYVAKQIYSSLQMGLSPGQICAIAPSPQIRGSIVSALREKGVSTAELRDDVDYESDNVKISTIESAKGHEFSAVYIMGLVDGLLPNADIDVEDLPREASRLYVAMTRAREKLVMTYSLRTGQSASRFLMSIQNDCDEAHYKNGDFRKITA
ncbi:3'-5' exonuclease [Rheinheimera aquimaris]|uniref:3'-5' exonuclease n=1 Tax=Rheinheimera aquimaris TaxID=412437 RepID=UPI003A974168